MEKTQLNETGHILLRKFSFERKQENLNTNDVQQSIQKGRETRFHFQKVLNFQYCLLLFSITNITLTILYYDADYVNKKSIASLCLYFISGTLVFEIIITIFRYIAQVELEKGQKILDSEESIMSSGKSISMVLEIIMLLFQPYPFFDSIAVETRNIFDNFSFSFKLNYILVLFGFVKFFIVVRVLLRRQIYMSPRSSRLCRMYGCESDYLYAIKCLFKDSPMSLIGIVFSSSIIIFALSFRIAQRNLNIQYPLHFNGAKNPQDIENFQNSLWLTIITMTTVGYGDFYPRTLFGRAIDVLLVIWGTFIVSLMVVVLTNTLNMDQSQKRALIVLNRLQAKKSLKDAAAFLITHTCRKYLIKKQINRGNRQPLSEQEQLKIQNSFYKYLTDFQNVHRIIRSMYQIDDVYQEMTRQFQFINDQITFLLSSQQQTITNLRNYLEDGKDSQKNDQNDDQDQNQNQD